MILCWDVSNQQLVSAKGGVASLPSFRRGKYAVTVYLVTPNTSGLQGSYVDYSATGFDGLRIGIWPTSAGTTGNVLALTDVTGWTYTEDSTGNYFTGTLNTNTTQWAAFLTGVSGQAYFAANLVKGLALTPIYDQKGATNCTIYAATDPGSGVAIDMTAVVPVIPFNTKFGPSPLGSYYILSETGANTVVISVAP